MTPAPRNQNDAEDVDFDISDFLPDQEKKPELAFCGLLHNVKCKLIVLFMVAGTVASLSIALTGSPNPVPFFVPVDPPGYAEAVRWDATTGLKLLVENACDDSWTQIFKDSIADWNQTEALILDTSRDFHEEDCNPYFGRLRVCNGDYGNTNWKGLNVILFRNGFVRHSVSKLNDYHLKQADDLQRRYTMCHELGHGFGLPHTDENHLNLNRGDCMDYTTRFRGNLKPGDFNLDLLEQLYGTPTQPKVFPEEEDGELLSSASLVYRTSGGRGLRSRRQQEEEEPPLESYWQLAHTCPHEHCTFELEGGYRVEVSKLLV